MTTPPKTKDQTQVPRDFISDFLGLYKTPERAILELARRYQAAAKTDASLKCFYACKIAEIIIHTECMAKHIDQAISSNQVTK